MLQAAEVSTKVVDDSEVKAIISAALSAIDDMIQKHVSIAGKNTIVYRLPEYFKISSMLRKTDVQQLVYAGIIQSLDERKFDVRIKLRESEHDTGDNLLYVSWKATVSSAQLSECSRVIKAHMLRPGERITDDAPKAEK